MGTIFFIVFLLVIAVTCLVVGLQANTRGRSWGRFVKGGGWVMVGLTFLTILLTSFTVVQAKEVGVLTTFGKPAKRTLGAGLNIKWPFQSVTLIDGTIQTDKYRAEECIYVRIGDGSRSCLTLTHRWQIVPERANETFANFRSNDPTGRCETPWCQPSWCRWHRTCSRSTTPSATCRWWMWTTRTRASTSPRTTTR